MIDIPLVEHIEERFRNWSRVPVSALLVGRGLDLRALDRSNQLSVLPVVIPAGQAGLAVLFRYGAIVMFQVREDEARHVLARVQGVVVDPGETMESETAEITIDPGEESERVAPDGVIRLRSVTLERLLVVADVLAKSVVLEYDEVRLARVFDRVEPVAEDLSRAGGRSRVPLRQLLSQIGDVLLTQHRMVGRVEVTEKPELLWDHPELERLYVRLQDEYELAERDRALNRKLELIAQTASTSLGLIQAHRSLRVEWYIVILIVIEIFISLYEMFVREPLI